MKKWASMIGFVISEVSSPDDKFNRPPDDLIIRALRTAYELIVYQLGLKTNTLHYPSQCGHGSAPFQPAEGHINPEISSVKVNGQPVSYTVGDGEVMFDAPTCGERDGVVITYRYSVTTDTCDAPDEVFVEPLRSMIIHRALIDLLSDSHMDWYSPNEARNHKFLYDELVMTRRRRRSNHRSANIGKLAGDMFWAT